MIKASFKPVDTDELDMTLTITMKMRHWKFLVQHITPNMGTSEFRNVVEAMIDKAQKNFEHTGIVDSGPRITENQSPP